MWNCRPLILRGDWAEQTTAMNQTDYVDDRVSKVLVVAHDVGTLAQIVDATNRLAGTLVTCAASAADALDIDCIDPHQLVIVTEHLPDMPGLDFARNVLALRTRPVVLIGESPRPGDIIHALRIGVADYVLTPLDPEYLRETVGRCLRCEQATERDARRRQNHRALLRRVLRDRRKLTQRIDLVCRDLVGAQRRLFHRVLDRGQSGLG